MIAVKSNKALVTVKKWDVDWVRVSIEVNDTQSSFPRKKRIPLRLKNNTRGRRRVF